MGVGSDASTCAFKQSGIIIRPSPPLVAGGVVIVAFLWMTIMMWTHRLAWIEPYDVKQGELKWNWDSGYPEEYNTDRSDETYATSSPNSWSVASADEKLGLAYFPMGNRHARSVSGMYRKSAAKKYATSCGALLLKRVRLALGSHVCSSWLLWDMDHAPAQPSLLDFRHTTGQATCFWVVLRSRVKFMF